MDGCPRFAKAYLGRKRWGVPGFPVRCTGHDRACGLDMSRWPGENHFASWLGLCPSNELSGGRILKKRTRKVVNRAATAFRMAASTLRTSQSYLGAKFRRLRSRLGPPKAITAMA